ncbi:TPA: efflux RND transporter periplasmic adaptor subunit, partial [Bacillus thuringiensis]|nr:efflux RND transporter periplasmic adaptor subunit [Bacillus thuringiensis]
MKKKNKLFIIGMITIGLSMGGYVAFIGKSEAVMAYKIYQVKEKQIQNAQKFGGE